MGAFLHHRPQRRLNKVYYFSQQNNKLEFVGIAIVGASIARPKAKIHRRRKPSAENGRVKTRPYKKLVHNNAAVGAGLDRPET